MGQRPEKTSVTSWEPEATHSGVRPRDLLPNAGGDAQPQAPSAAPPAASEPPPVRATKWALLALFGFSLGAFVAQRVVPLLLD